jgi:Spy/CpxP family protein refolding chaperone
MKVTLTCLTLLLASAAVTAQTSPYAGEQARPIKALGADELRALTEGRGFGFAKAAELNGYPGPMHVVELANRLDLTPEQRSASERLLTEHKARARELGARVIDAERALDALFAQRQADAAAVDAATRRVGELHAALRAEHLKTHLEQTALLNSQQIAHYQRLRGYDLAPEGHDKHHR